MGEKFLMTFRMASSTLNFSSVITTNCPLVALEVQNYVSCVTQHNFTMLRWQEDNKFRQLSHNDLLVAMQLLQLDDLFQFQ